MEQGIAPWLSYHEARAARSAQALYEIDRVWDFSPLIKPPDSSLYKCRILYDSDIQQVEWHPYSVQIPRVFHLRESSIEYPHKLADRSAINALRQDVSVHEEILIVRDGVIRDASIANIALRIDGIWLTPIQPLLRGVAREIYLAQGRLSEAELLLSDLDRATGLALMNAMIGWVEVDDFTIRRKT